MSDSTHVDVYFYINDKPFFVGHGDVVKGDDGLVKGEIASLLHRLAWSFEELEMKDAGVEDSGDNRATPKPRKVTTPTGLIFWEVAPGEFSPGDNWVQSQVSYGRGLVVSEDQIRKHQPKSFWEYVD